MYRTDLLEQWSRPIIIENPVDLQQFSWKSFDNRLRSRDSRLRRLSSAWRLADAVTCRLGRDRLAIDTNFFARTTVPIGLCKLFIDPPWRSTRPPRRWTFSRDCVRFFCTWDARGLGLYKVDAAWEIVFVWRRIEVSSWKSVIIICMVIVHSVLVVWLKTQVLEN